MYQVVFACTISPWYTPGPYCENHPSKNMGARYLRDAPTELFNRVKLAAAVERRSVKGVLLALAEERNQELEKNGLLPKGK